MGVSNVKIDFKAPALPQPTEMYDPTSYDIFNNVLRLYFNHQDEAFRQITQTQDSLESLTWFMS